jgi:hypothetical protein
MLGENLLESLFVLSFNHQNPQLGLIALTGGLMAIPRPDVATRCRPRYTETEEYDEFD